MQHIKNLYNRYFEEKLDLSSLPPDIQQQILSQDPELIRKGRQLNTQLRSRLTNVYLDEICNMPIKEIEYVDNLKSNKTWFMYREYKTREVYTFDFVIDWEKNKANTITIIKDLNTNTYIFIISYNTEIQPKFHEIKGTGKFENIVNDAMNIWLIYSQRHDCVNLDPDYARKKTIELFQSSQYVGQSKSKSIHDLLLRYGYLITQLWIFKVKFTTQNIFTIDVDRNDYAIDKTDSDYLKNIIDDVEKLIINTLNTVKFDYDSNAFFLQ